ncbi:TRAP transporter large permease [Chryseomicrobium palamuruense]|uniref:TRAP transporter large permease n=1 Tax=Chryseomicrobium palamuruense TaxID=682973 RepID=A0ABV8UVX6_9BACL
MTENIVLFIVILIFLYFLTTGMYISSLLFFVGILGIYLIGGSTIMNGFLQGEPFARVASYSLTTIPLYILMAQFIMQAGIVKDLYDLAYKLSKGRGGVLGVLTVFIGGLLGGVSGSGTATSAALGQIAVPELIRRGYPPHLAGSLAAASGSLSAIIPPSVFLILYGVVAQISIGQLFTAAMIPGILMMLVFAGTTLVYLKIYGKEFEANAIKNETNEETSVMRYVTVVLAGTFIVAAIFGGIYMGIFTPTEAGAIGAFIAFILAVVLKKVSLKFLKVSFVETIKVTTMAMFIVVGASLFGRFISLSLVPRKIIDLLGPLMESPVLIITIIMVFYFFLFMFIEGVAVILMTVPIITPILDQINADPLWFGIMLTVVCTLGMLTPPVGISVYAVGGVTGIPIERLFKTSTVFAVVATIIVIGLLIAFPQLVTWLPSQMR